MSKRRKKPKAPRRHEKASAPSSAPSPSAPIPPRQVGVRVEISLECNAVILRFQEKTDLVSFPPASALQLAQHLAGAAQHLAEQSKPLIIVP